MEFKKWGRRRHTGLGEKMVDKIGVIGGNGASVYPIRTRT